MIKRLIDEVGANIHLSYSSILMHGAHFNSAGMCGGNLLLPILSVLYLLGSAFLKVSETLL